jgi:hypothetical protein
MARIHTPDETVRKAYRLKLSPQQRKHFIRLCALIDRRSTDLTWYHSVGCEVRKLLLQRPEDRRGWYNGLAEALGPSPAVLRKTVRFVKRYRRLEDIQTLERQRSTWTMVYLTFRLKPADARKLLKKAGDEKWNDTRFGAELNRLHPSERLGAGGWLPLDLQDLGVEKNLHKFARLTEQWLKFYEEIWRAQTDDLQVIVGSGDAKIRERRSKLIDQLARSLRVLTRTAKAAAEQLKPLGPTPTSE